MTGSIETPLVDLPTRRQLYRLGLIPLVAGLLLAAGGFLLWPFAHPYLYLWFAPSPPDAPLAELAAWDRKVTVGKGLEGATISIPSIKLRAPMVEGVTVKDLAWGAGHVPGTAMPGKKGSVVVTAHNYALGMGKILFTLLHKARVGDEVVIYEHGKRHLYEITKRRILSPENVDFTDPGGKPRLVMITCYPPGTIKLRLVVEAKYRISLSR